MRDYGKVYTAFWTSEDVRAMTEDERTLALYLLTCPHGNMLGCFRLPDAYAAEDLAWQVERVSKGFAELSSKGYAYRCERSAWVVISRYLKWNQLENPNVGKAAGKMFEALTAPHEIKVLLVKALRDFSPAFPRAILEKFESLSKAFRTPSGLSPESGAVAVAVASTPTGAGTGAAAVPPPAEDAEPELEAPHVAPLPMRETPPLSDDPAIQLAVRLRRQGVNVQFTHPAVQTWVSEGVAPEVLDAAVRTARERLGETAKINGNYLVPIVQEIQSPQRSRGRSSSRPSPNAIGVPKGADDDIFNEMRKDLPQ